MIKLSLKSILSKKNETASILASLIERLNAGIWIEDDTGNILLGTRSEPCKVEHAIKVENEVIGVVKGDDEANIIAAVLRIQYRKKPRRKSSGPRY